MYKRWKQLKEEFNIQKEYIKNIINKDSTYQITIVDEDNTKMFIDYDKTTKLYSITILDNENIGIPYTYTNAQHISEYPIFYN